MDKGRVSALKGLTLYESLTQQQGENVQTDGVAEGTLVGPGVGQGALGDGAYATDGTGLLVHRCLSGRDAEVYFVV